MHGKSGILSPFHEYLIIGALGWEKRDATTSIVEHGSGYNLFYIILYGYIRIDILITIIAFGKKRVSKKSLYLLIALQSITIFCFLIGRAIDSTFEIMPLLYVIDGFFCSNSDAFV